MDVSKVTKSQVKHLATGNTITFESLWEDKTCIIIFFRRWGCLFCRLWAKEISEIAPILKKHDIRLIGIGQDDIGAKEFLEGNFLDGELYGDIDRNVFGNLDFKRYNHFSILTSLLRKESRDAIAKGKQMKLGGDLRGDWVQNGGAAVIEKGGNVLFTFKQDGPAEHVSNEEFLKILKLEHELPTLPKSELTGEREKLACSEECTR